MVLSKELQMAVLCSITFLATKKNKAGSHSIADSVSSKRLLDALERAGYRFDSRLKRFDSRLKDLILD